MTHAFILEFASQDDLDYYLTTEPVHKQFSRDAKPLIEDSLVVDIKDGVLSDQKLNIHCSRKRREFGGVVVIVKQCGGRHD